MVVVETLGAMVAHGTLGNRLFYLSVAPSEFEGILGRKVDLVTEGGLHPQLRDRVLRDAQVVYARAE